MPKRTGLNSNIIAIISFLWPFTAAILGVLSISSNRNKGRSKGLFTSFLIFVSYYFFYHTMRVLDMGRLQQLVQLAYPMAGLALGPVLYLFGKSLLTPQFKLLPEDRLHMVPALLSIPLTLGFALTLPLDQYLQALNVIMPFETTGVKLYGYFTILLEAVFIPGITLWYLLKLRKRQRMHRDFYGKYYAELERKNERLIMNTYGSLLFIQLVNAALMVYPAGKSMPVIIINILFGALVVLMINWGKNQIDMRKYRMYKLSSHEQEVTAGGAKNPH